MARVVRCWEHSLEDFVGLCEICLSHEDSHSFDPLQNRKRGRAHVCLDNRLDPVGLELGLHQVGLCQSRKSRQSRQDHHQTVLPALRYSAPMPGFDITSPQNERIKRLRRLRDRRHRDEEGVFVVEGVRLFERALRGGLEPLEVYVDGTVDYPAASGEIRVEPSTLDRASYRKSSQGLIAVFSQWTHRLEDLVVTDSSLMVVVESLEKPGNLGAMMRTATAIGADGFVTISGSCDPFNPNTIRSSTGALFSLRLAQTTLPEFRDWIGDKHLALFALTPEASKTIWEVDLVGPSAIMIGAEDSGLSTEALTLAEAEVSIPMESGEIDSLNASVALAVAGFEALRQRRSPRR